MREILFRGKDIQGYWHIGLLAHLGNSWYISNKAGVSTAYEVIPDTVGQYTGKNIGKRKIFEGDIFEFTCDYYDSWGYAQFGCYNGVVVWDSEYFAWEIKQGDEINSFCDEIFDDATYLGNIHDNPELLKGGTIDE